MLALPRDAAKVMAEASEMRAMIEKEKPPRDLWDIKLIPGGLIDLEFIAQVAVITGQVEAGRRVTGTAEILSRLAPDFADAEVRQELGDAYALYLALTQMTRLCLTGAFERRRRSAGAFGSASGGHRPAGFRCAGSTPQGDVAKGQKGF